MFGFPAISEHFLTVDPIDGVAGHWILENMNLIYLYTLPYVYPIGLTAQTASVYITIVLTIERLVKVYLNLQACNT